MNKIIQIDSDKKIKEIRNNLYTIHQYLLKKVISDERLFYSRKIINGNDLYKEYRKIRNSPLNIYLRITRWFFKYSFYVIITPFVFSFIFLLSSFYFQNAILSFCTKYNLNASYFIKLINFIEHIISYIEKLG